MTQYRNTDGPLTTYLIAISKYPLLTKAQEKELANKIAEGCLESRDMLIKCNLRLVVNIAKQNTYKKYNLSDIIEDGNMGLIRAVELYDSSYDTRFSTYATWWIRQSIRRGHRSVDRLVRLPAYMSELIGKWNRAKTKLWDLGVIEPSDEQIAKELGLKNQQIPLIKSARYGMEMSEVDPDTGMDYIYSVPDKTHEERYGSEEIAAVMKNVDKLPPNEHDVICMRYGLNGEELTLEQVGNIIGVTRERVRQIQIKAISRLKYWAGLDRPF